MTAIPRAACVVLVVVSFLASPDPTIAQQPPAQATKAAEKAPGKGAEIIYQAPGLATAASVQEQANLLRAQTEAIKALAQKIDALEARISALEEKKQAKKPN